MFRAIFCPKHVELILEIHKLLLLHLVGSFILLYLRSACLSVCLYVCLSVSQSIRPKGTARSSRTDFHEVWFAFSRKSVEKIQVSLQSEKNKGYITWTLMYIYDYSLISFLELEILQTKVVLGIKRHILCSMNFFSKIVPLMRLGEKNLYSQTGHIWPYTRVGTLIVATIYLQLIQNRYMFRSFTVLHCSHQHCVQPVASDVEVVGYL